MAFIPCAGVAEVALQFSQSDGSFAENTFYVHNATAWDSTRLTDICAAFKVWFATGDGTHAYQKTMADDTNLIAISARDLTTATSAVVTYNSGLPLVGLSGGNTFALGTTWAVTWRTGLAGRSKRGRTFIVGVYPGMLSDASTNEISSSIANDIVSAFNALPAAVTAALAGSALVVLSRYSGTDSAGKPIPRAAGVVTDITVAGYHNLLLDFQRRRAPAHNRHH